MPLLLLAAALAAPGLAAGAGVGLGVDARSVGALADEGVGVAYGLAWAGEWNARTGWGGVAERARSLAQQGVQPVVMWYYWGDAISPACVQAGCEGRTLDGWFAGAEALADTLHAALQGRPGLVVLESEFNKNGIELWEDFDGLLARQAQVFRARAPEVQVVVGFGNWGSGHWHRFDRAAAEADLVGFQTLRSAARHDPLAYLRAADDVERAVATLHDLFGKPVLLYDLALSSWGGPAWEHHQEGVLDAIFARLDRLEGLGLVGIVYRAWQDAPGKSEANHHGPAERHWGLVRADGQPKPALGAWLRGAAMAQGARAQEAAQGPAPGPAAGPGEAWAMQALGPGAASPPAPWGGAAGVPWGPWGPGPVWA